MTYIGGKQFTVNLVTAGGQDKPDLVALNGGGWATVYESFDMDPAGGMTEDDILLAWLNPNGSQHGSTVQVNGQTNGSQQDNAIARLADGSFIVTWHSNALGDWNIYQQRYSAEGVKIGSEAIVNTVSFTGQMAPDVAGLANGGWVVVWQGNMAGSDGTGVFAQRFDASGAAVGVRMTIADEPAATEYTPSVTALSNGNFVVTWATYDASGADPSGIYQSLIGANGFVIFSNLPVNAATAGTQTAPVIAAVTGGYVTSWTSLGQDGDGKGVYFQKFDLSGNKIGAETLVNTTVAGDQGEPAIASLKDGGWVVVWTSEDNQDGAGTGVYMQIFNADGTRNGGETLVNEITAGDQDRPSVTVLDDGRIVVGWASTDVDGSNEAICERVFSLDLSGTATNNNLSGTDSGETISGLSGNDQLVGNGGVDILIGNRGNDRMDAGAGDDTLLGGAGRDALTGGTGYDRLQGGTGNDKLWGSSGNDILTGGTGKDIFIFKTGDGEDTIADFQDGDRIDLGACASITGFADLKANHMSVVGDDIRIDAGNGDILVLDNVTLKDLSAGDFIF